MATSSISCKRALTPAAFPFPRSLNSPKEQIELEGFNIDCFGQLREDLHEAGIQLTHVVSWRTPKDHYKHKISSDGWLVLFGTGFDQQLHAPVAK